MISFIWPSGEAMVSGAGGSETFTAGHVRELLRQGLAAQVVVANGNLFASRSDFPDIPFLGFSDEREISQLEGDIVFVNRAYDVPTKTKATILLHCVVPSKLDRKARMRDVQGKNILATSIYNAQQWALYLGVPSGDIRVVMPFADPAFGSVKRADATEKTRVLYAGRLHPEKGIYTILEMLHYREIKRLNMEMTIVMAGQHVETGKVIASMLKSYPYARLVDPVRDVASMAVLLAETDILLMPSVFEEPFGMLSVEAQHAGCRVIASSLGGLPETNCGLLTLVEQRNPAALIAGIKSAIQLGAATSGQRERATTHFTLTKSVSELLAQL
ncbi:glycosyltransferase family 4 protein [Candidatus Saccharibacteria bacterium]|nr:glycosyltransferase family 4 protein [Candidatus Saccharibacteria bacterium]